MFCPPRPDRVKITTIGRALHFSRLIIESAKLRGLRACRGFVGSCPRALVGVRGLKCLVGSWVRGSKYLVGPWVRGSKKKSRGFVGQNCSWVRGSKKITWVRGSKKSRGFVGPKFPVGRKCSKNPNMIWYYVSDMILCKHCLHFAVLRLFLNPSSWYHIILYVLQGLIFLYHIIIHIIHIHQ